MSSFPIRVCSTKIPPELPSLVVFKDNRWENNSVLRIRIFNGDPQIKEKVIRYASMWLEYINLKFEFVEHGDAHIRISLNSQGLHDSLIGTDALQETNQEKPTMNLGLLGSSIPEDEFKGTVLHEFGHALGCGHEHQHPLIEIKWNRDNVYADYICKYRWRASEVDSNILNAIDKAKSHHSEPDLKSIMIYTIPKEHLEAGDAIEGNNELSEMDKTFIRSQYP